MMFLSNLARNTLFSASCFIAAAGLIQAETPRVEYSINSDWKTIADEDSTREIHGFTHPDFDDSGWESVTIPHNWDGYEGFRQAKHGVFHGSAWYRREFKLPPDTEGKQIFVHFEGVGSFASVWVNGTFVGKHAGGLTTFTLDISDAVNPDGPNVMAVRADHPDSIRDLPWVCGGCELAYGFSEGTQPFGIFRPAKIVITEPLRIEPFGVHIWNSQDISEDFASLNFQTEIKNYRDRLKEFTLKTRLVDKSGDTVLEVSTDKRLRPGTTTIVSQKSPEITDPHLWSLDDPYLYNVVSELYEDGKLVDSTVTPYGIRWIEWPGLDDESPREPIRINGEPVFINGVADYEHLLGESHAFSQEQIHTRVRQIQAAGFNAFRDAHHPHNLRFNQYWDRDGMLWWTQFGAHIWFEKEDFYHHYKKLLRDWVKERRNSPSLFMYTIQNESKLPAEFANECMDIIRNLDPTASIQRPVVTCNGGSGTDWDVPQNWSGTYGGDLFNYDNELREQRMVGEYGAWRSIDYHSEGGFIEDGPLTEDRMAALMETKVRLGEKVRNEAIGHFAWPFTTHQNPGRNVGSRGQQTLDGIRELDRIGPANNKGLQTIWGEPLDVYYMYRSNYVSPESQPMVYIVSHTWPDRWTEPGNKDGIIVYSNCDEVELFNGYKTRSLGVRQRNGKGTHFRWDDVNIETNMLYAEARYKGETVATDVITLNHLPEDPTLKELDPDPENLTQPREGNNYLFRINAGGPEYTDINGNRWLADRDYTPGDSWGSISWAHRFANLRPAFGSKREIFDPIKGTRDDALFQSFRYGRDKLKYVFEVPNGDYSVELYFIEPWYGTGGGLDCSGWRLFDVAVNENTVLENLDIWSEAGRAGALKKVVPATVSDGVLEISFPRILSNQAVISAIAVSTKRDDVSRPELPAPLITKVSSGINSLQGSFEHKSQLDTGIEQYSDTAATFSFIPWELRESEWIQTPLKAVSSQADDTLTFSLTADADVYVAFHSQSGSIPSWLEEWNETSMTLNSTWNDGTEFPVFRKRFNAGDHVITGPSSKEKSGSMYTVIAKRRIPPPPGESILNLEARESASPGDWQAVGNLKAGRVLYSDRTSIISEFSSRLSDSDWIRTPEADAANPNLSVNFSVDDHTEVFVGLDPRISSVPEWMSDWIATDWHISTATPEERRYQLFKQRFEPGDTVRLGPNGKLPGDAKPVMYTVILRSVRADKRYEAESLNAYRHLIKTDDSGFSGDGYLELAGLDSEAFDWVISVGVGDRYGLNFRYKSEAEDPVRAQLTIIDERDGHIVCEDEVIFDPTRGDQWQFSRNRTCDSINAGTYFIRLESPDLGKLKFDAIDVE